MNGTGENNISPFNRARKYSTPVRDDVGIVPYNETGGTCHTTKCIPYLYLSPPLISLALLDSFPPGEAEGW